MGKTRHTPGPWQWNLNLASRQVELESTVPSHFRETVLAFRRWGMNGAKVMFCSDKGILEPVEQFAQVIKGREHHANWAQSVNHPDALLIAAAPDLLAACEVALARIESDVESDTRKTDEGNALRAAITKATAST